MFDRHRFACGTIDQLADIVLSGDEFALFRPHQNGRTMNRMRCCIRHGDTPRTAGRNCSIDPACPCTMQRVWNQLQHRVQQVMAHTPPALI